MRVVFRAQCPLADIADAHRALENRGVREKIVVTVPDGRSKK